MATTSAASATASDLPDPVLRAAVAAHLARYTDANLRVFLRWCAAQHLDPLIARRGDVELVVRWLQEACLFKPSTVCRRLSVVVGFYRTCVIDGLLEHSAADYTTTAGRIAAVQLTGSASTSWTESALTGPDGTAGRNNAFALACPTTSGCLTAGGYQDMWGINQLATGSGAPTLTPPWPQSKATPPSNAHITNGDAPPLHLACGSATLCVAAGTYTDNTGHTQGFLLTR